ncbi:phosphate ABC transporter permease PstA [uncultured Ferrimonas sp.]|uniref:phosphate ABC transporter permease PstA n=1 Tax=uncultured Ferrimonas sp. TaxID=432640 RepID=UPI002629EF61|nr:phosphate ABC transporter permease PstA [uncultured Ferrimonas sp.]
MFSRDNTDRLLLGLIWGSAIVTMAFLIWILFYIVSNGLSFVDWHFITDNYTRTGAEAGIWPMIVSTLYMVLLSVAIAAPIGIMTAIYLTEYAKPGSHIVALIRFCTESLAGIPSIIYGLFGLTFFVSIMGLGFSILAGALTLSMLILPVIIRTSEEAIMAVPVAYREASFGLGASRLYTVVRVILPAAMPGIVTALILSIGRIIGESAPVYLTAGMVANIPESVFDSGRTLTVHLYMLTTELYTQHDWDMAFATATVLIVVVLMINLFTKFVSSQFSKATY